MDYSENIKQNDLNKIFKQKNSSREEARPVLNQLWDLPNDPGAFIKNLQPKFLHYGRLVSDFKNFAAQYSSIQRLWPNKPIFLEIDGLFNFLYHEAENTPSFNFAKEKPRQLTENQQMREIKKWALLYKQWNDERDEDDIEWRIRNSKKVKQLLSPKNIFTLTEKEVRQALLCTNSLGSKDKRNISMIFKRNKVVDIINALNELVNGQGQLESRMNSCNRVKNIGAHTIYEILGLFYPDKYPTINKNSNSGLRFFGYKIKAYN